MSFDPFDIDEKVYRENRRAARQEERAREARAVTMSRGVPDLPDGPVWHHDGCFRSKLHLGDCRVDPLSRSTIIDTPATEMAPAEEAERHG